MARPGLFLAMIAVIAFVSATTNYSLVAQPQEDGWDADVRRLLELSGVAEVGEMMGSQMIDAMAQAMPEVPQEFWDEFSRELDMEELIDRIIPVYKKHLTHEDVRELIAFYESPIGRKLVEKQPLIMQESMAIGEQWGQEAGMRAMQRLQRQGGAPR